MNRIPPLSLTSDMLHAAKCDAERIVEQVHYFNALREIDHTDWYRHYHKERVLHYIHELAKDVGFKLVPLTDEEKQAIRAAEQEEEPDEQAA